MWLIIGAAALLLLQSALIAALLVHRVQRRRVRRALAERLRFETLLSDLSAMFAAGPVTEVDQQIGIGLRRIVEDLGADRATVGTLSTSSDLVLATHSWTREGVAPLRESIRGVAVPWIVSQVRRGQVVALRRLADLPPEATADRECLTRLGTRSTVVVPLVVGGAVTATLSVGMLREERPWPDELIPRLRLLAAVFASALARQQAERAVRESEERFRRMADSAPMMVWFSGADGRRTYVNQRWLDFTGRSLGLELGETWMESVHPDDCVGSRADAGERAGHGAAVHHGVPAAAAGRGVPVGARPRSAPTLRQTARSWATSARSSTSPSSAPPSGRCSRPTSCGARSSGRSTATWRRWTSAGGSSR